MIQLIYSAYKISPDENSAKINEKENMMEELLLEISVHPAERLQENSTPESLTQPMVILVVKLILRAPK